MRTCQAGHSVSQGAEEGRAGHTGDQELSGLPGSERGGAGGGQGCRVSRAGPNDSTPQAGLASGHMLPLRLPGKGGDWGREAMCKAVY